jgi:hypothetical protein
MPAGLQYHLTDIYVPELDKALAAFPEVGEIFDT